MDPEGVVGCIRLDGGRATFLRRGCALTFGRDPAAAVSIDETYASRQHIALISHKEDVWVVDTSRNGTVLLLDDFSGVRLKREGLVVKGDFKFHIATNPASTTEAAPGIYHFTKEGKPGSESVLPSNSIPSKAIPLNSLPSKVKDVVEHLPTKIDLRALRPTLNKVRPASTWTEKPSKEGWKEWRETHSEYQAFTIFDMFNKKLPLPVKPPQGETKGSTPVVTTKKRPTVVPEERNGSTPMVTTMKKRRVHAPKTLPRPVKRISRASKVQEYEFDDF